ncbi:MAG: UvrD-helicase domain-containing protein, partial [Clostridia bacterium]|nr:UvrD-helicase domain-containing protein [Clostridia bacterium]
MADFIQCRRKILEREYKNLNTQQKKAVFHTDGPLLVLAGAGSGKTTVIIHRIENLIRFGSAYESEYVPTDISEQDVEVMEWYANGDIDELPPHLESYLAEDPVKPWQILAITFTNKAAGELKSRLVAKLGDEGNDINAGTFHSMCVKFLRRDIDKLGYDRSFTIYDTADQQTVIKACLKELSMDDKKYAPRALLSQISNAKDALISPAEFERQYKSDYYMSKVAEVYSLYQKKLKSNNALDFDDLIVKTVELFEECPDVLNYYHNKYRYILVDEYQDTNHAQYKLVSLLASAHENLCVVGDDDQSIYRFRGADIRNILEFEKEFKNCCTIKLEENYRSTQNILDAANNVISNNAGRKGKQLWTSNGSGDKISIFTSLNEHSEAQFIAEKIEELGGSFSDTVILYRMNAMSRIVEDMLLRSAIPYRVLGGLRFYDRKEIKDITSYLRLIWNFDDDVALQRVINEPKRGIGAATVEKAADVAAVNGTSICAVCAEAEKYEEIPAKAGMKLKDFSALISGLRSELEDGMGLELFCRTVMERTGMIAALKAEKTVENETRLENLEEFISMVQEAVKADELLSLGEMLENISLISDIDNYDEDQDTVTLMTLHSAKGLEFPNVFLIGMEEGIFPGMRSFGDESEIEEERRLCYVG